MKLAEAAVQLETRDQANPDQTQKNAQCVPISLTPQDFTFEIHVPPYCSPSNSIAECELLSHACCLLGQCLESTANGSHLQVEKAIEAYFKSARLGANCLRVVVFLVSLFHQVWVPSQELFSTDQGMPALLECLPTCCKLFT